MDVSYEASAVKNRYSAYARLSSDGVLVLATLICIARTWQVTRHLRRLGREVVLLHFSPERHRADIQCGGRALAVALESLECVSNQLPFLRAEIQRVAQRSGLLLRHFRRQLSERNRRSMGQNGRPLDRMFELAYVPWPSV